MDEKYAVIKLAVEHSKLKVEREQFITSKSRQSIFIQINFRTNDWDNVQKTVIFNDEYIRTLDEENCCDIPVEAILEEGLLKIGVFGIDGDTRINTNQVCFKIFEGSYNEGIEPADITQSMYEQIMSAINSKVSKTTTIAGLPLDRHITAEELEEVLQIPSMEGIATEEYVDNSIGQIRTSMVFDSYEAATTYASTSTKAYIGQSITVVDNVNDIVTVYVISNSNMELSSVGSSSNVYDYNNIENKPKINGVTLIGDKSSEDLNIDTVSMTNSDIEAILF